MTGFGGHTRADSIWAPRSIALPRAPPVLERGQQRDAGVHTDDGIGGSLRVARRPVGIT